MASEQEDALVSTVDHPGGDVPLPQSTRPGGKAENSTGAEAAGVDGPESSPATGGAADVPDREKPSDLEDERKKLKAEARELELQALRESVQQLRDKLFQAQLQRIAKSIDAACSIM